MSAGRRANGEGSIYPYRDGMFAAYVWVSTPDGKRRRKYVYGKTRELVHTKWLELHRVAAVGPVSTTTPTLSEYMTYWLREVVAPSLKPKTSLLAAQDVHPRVAMQILRHSKIAVTMEIYTHIPSELTRNALHKLGDSLDGLT